MFGQSSKISRGEIPVDAEWNRMVAKAAGARPWVMYILLLLAAVFGVWQAREQLLREREVLIDRQKSEMEMMSLGVESPYHAGSDHMMLAATRLMAQGLTAEDFSQPPPREGERPSPRLVELGKMLSDKSLFARSLLPSAGMVDSRGELLVGKLPPGMDSESLRTRIGALPKPKGAQFVTWIGPPRREEKPPRWVMDSLIFMSDTKGGFVGGFVLTLAEPALRAWNKPGDRGAPGEHSRAFIIHSDNLRVCTSMAGAAFVKNLPGAGDPFVFPEFDAALASGVRDKKGVIVFWIPERDGMPPFMCRLETGRFSLGYHVLVQSDENVVLAPWRASLRRTAGVGLVVLLFAGLALFFDARRRRLRGELTVMRTELAVRRRQEEDMVRLNAELEGRVEARTAELSSVNAELAEANRELDAYARTVTHDLRAPIRSIRSYADILVEDHSGALAPEVRIQLEKIRAKSRRMAELVEEIFRLARSSHAKPHRALTDLSAMCTEILAGMREADPGRTVVLHVTPGCVANSDPALTRIVLENLLGNAWKYSSKSPKTVIDFGRETRDGVSMFYVRDKGAGFDPAKADALFKPFSRLHTVAQFEGTGVGLATVARIVRLHGGEIIAEGRPGEGAVFRFTLSPMDGEG